MIGGAVETRHGSETVTSSVNQYEQQKTVDQINRRTLCTFSNSFSWMSSMLWILFITSLKSSPCNNKSRRVKQHTNTWQMTAVHLHAQTWRTWRILSKKGIPNVPKTSLWKCATGISISFSLSRSTWSRGISCQSRNGTISKQHSQIKRGSFIILKSITGEHILFIHRSGYEGQPLTSILNVRLAAGDKHSSNSSSWWTPIIL